jgi:hypothetical protein
MMDLPENNSDFDDLVTDFGPDGPQPGTAAYSAFILAQMFPENDDDIPEGFWDDWKDQVKGE